MTASETNRATPPARTGAHRLLSLLGPSERSQLAAVAALQAVERIGVILAVLQLLARGPWKGAAISAVLALIFTLRSAISASLRRHVRAALAAGIAQCLLASDALTQGGEDAALASAIERFYMAQNFVSGIVPTLLADLVASVPILIIVGLRVPLRVLLVGGIALIAASTVVLAARSVTTRLAESTEGAFQPIFQRLVTAVGGRLELVASGRGDEFLSGLRNELSSWQRVAGRGELLSALAGRAPVAVAVLIVGGAVAMDYAARDAVIGVAWGEAALLAAAAPVFIGLSRGVYEARRMLTWLRPLLSLLDSSPGPEGGPAGTPLPRLPAPITIRGLSFSFPRCDNQPGGCALRDLSFEWLPDRVLLVQGPNGSGKTTLLRLLLGLGRPLSGGVSVAGTDLFDLDLRAWRRTIAYLPQRPYLPERASVRDAIRLIARGAADAAMQSALSRVALWEMLALRAPADPLSVRTGELSVGQRQRLALARVLCQEASIVILDEPDSGLDREGIALVAQLVRELSQQGMIAIAAHDPVLLGLGQTLVSLESIEADDTAGHTNN